MKTEQEAHLQQTCEFLWEHGADWRLLHFMQNWFNRVKSQRLLQEEEEEHRRRAVPLEVPDWRNVSEGTVVKRSEHWLRETSNTQNKEEIERIGLVTDLKFFEDDLCHVVTYPVIFWAGSHMANIVHPINAVPVKGDKLPTITMNANQQAKEH